MLLKCQQRSCAEYLARDFLFGQRGKLIMEYTQAMEMANVIKLEQSIRWHLQCNLSPPVPNKMISIALKAVMLCRKNKFSEDILLPFGRQVAWMVPAYVIVEVYHLEPWLNELDMG
jgi:hypothetical protein